MTNNTQSILAQGEQLLRDFDIAQAEAHFQQATRLMPNSSQVYIGLARLQLIKGEPKRAFMCAKKAASLADNNGDAQALMASCMLDEDRISEAVVLLEQTHRRFPNNALVLSNLGKALAKNGDYKEAKEYSLMALKLGACKEEIEHDLGIICSGLHEFEEAVDHFVASIAANPTYLPPYFRLSQFALLLNLVDETIELYENGVAMMPDMVQLREELHVLYQLKQEPEKAMQEALEIAMRRGWSLDYMRVGNTALLLGEVEAAEHAYRTAYEVDSEELGALINIAHLYRVTKRRDEAFALYREVSEKLPSLYKPYLGIGLVYMEIDEDYQKARLCLMKALELEKGSYDVLIQLGTCSAALGFWEEVEYCAMASLQLADSPRDIERAKELLAQVAQVNTAN